MNETAPSVIQALLQQQRDYFATGQTLEYRSRIKNLKRLKIVIRKYDQQIAEALFLDLHKSYQEAFLTEISLVLGEIDQHLKRLKSWMAPDPIATPWFLQVASSRVIKQPLGVSLVMAPWNYPFMLLMNPLIGALSAGCTAILKPSPYSSHTARLIQRMMEEAFDPACVSVIQGGRQTNADVLKERFDVIFFTGSSEMGKVVMEAASRFLTPVILELGGKCPCIVDEKANLKIAAKRIAWGKMINAGQSCIAPDYLLVHEDLRDELIDRMKNEIHRMYGSDLKASPFYPRIINQKAFDRITRLIQPDKVVYGGQADRNELFIHPTILSGVLPQDPVMQEEIFGPVLPVLTFRHISEAVRQVNLGEKPLAFYYFGRDKRAKEVLLKTTSGGVCVNDTMMHIVNNRLPFGGTGTSGLGKYHGKHSFDAFSHKRSVVSTASWIDFPFRYSPYKGFRLLKRVL